MKQGHCRDAEPPHHHLKRTGAELRPLWRVEVEVDQAGQEALVRRERHAAAGRGPPFDSLLRFRGCDGGDGSRLVDGEDDVVEDLESGVISGLGRDGADGVLRLVCENIRSESLTTPGQVIGHFASSPIAAALKQAFEYTPVLDVSFLKAEFVERLRRRASRADHRRRQAEMAELIHRAPSSLTEDERQQLRAFYAQQNSSQ